MAQVLQLSTGVIAGSVTRHGHLNSCECNVCIRPSTICAPKVSMALRSVAAKTCKRGGLYSHKIQGWASSEVMGQAGPKLVKGSDVGRRRAAFIVRAGPPPESSNIMATLLDVGEADRQKFEGMPYRRNVFTFDDWKKHRSSGRYIRHVQTMIGSRVISSLGPAVFAMTGISALVVTINTLVIQHALPEWMPLLHINPLPFSLTSSALSFLLVFRTNASYGRFDEARKMWGLMLNRSRDIGRQALSYMARGEYAHERPKLLQFLRHLQAFPLAYKHHLVQEGDLEYDLKTLTKLTEAEIKGVLSATHRPNYVLQMCSECMASCHMDPVPRLSMDANLTTFADDVGGSERIFKTPIPLSYTRLTSRFLVLWHVFLPLGLWDACGALTVPVTAFITAVLFCVEEVGVLIEEPFSILALGVISQSARNNVQELLDMHDGMKSLIVPNDPIVTPSSAPSSPMATLGNGVATEPAPTPASAPSAAPAASVPGPMPVMSSSLLPPENGTAIITEAPSWSRRS